MTTRIIVLAAALGACGKHAAPADKADSTSAAATPAAPDLRLPPVAKPTHEDVDLTIDPNTEAFTGKITTELDLIKPVRTLWLDAVEITIDDASIMVGSEHLPATTTAPKVGFVGLTFPKELPAGKAILAIKYHGKMQRSVGSGIFTAKEADNWYAFTQFEPTDARRAFPCFDEPSFKVPWHLTIHAKHELMVLSNTPVEAETDEPNGMKAVRFAETLPLPSYLVAFAVGPFETVDAGKTKSGAPIRIVVPHGHTADVAYPVQSTKRIIDALEDYFGSPYPFPKLDALAVATLAGAMENAGLITYHDGIILTKPDEMTRSRQETYATVAAHEMAHQWFGDKVTLAWWNDTWLNESFASWMEAKIITQLEPTWDGEVSEVHAKSDVMRNDSLDSARVIRQPIDNAGDIESSFDSITYLKGEAVLTMIERWMTPEIFQKGVRAYIAKHALGNATYDDFVGAMTDAAGKDMKPMFDAFVLQSGVPLVSVKLDCEAGAAPKLELAQRRYVPTGSKIDPKRTWKIPVCVRWGAGAETGRECTLLGEPTGELTLSAKTCPTWVLPNAGELGYYRMLPQGDLLAHLLANTHALTLAERVGLVDDVRALIGSGDVELGVALQLVGDLSKDNNRHIVDLSIGIVEGLGEVVTDPLRPNFERFIRKLYQARAHELGFAAKPGEDDNQKRLRASLLKLVAGDGRDPELIKEATALAWKWLDDHKAVQPELVGAVLDIAAKYGDQKLYDRLYADAKKATDKNDRARLLGSLGAFSDPKILAQALAISLDPQFDFQEGFAALGGAFQDPRTRMIAYEFVKQHFDEIMNRVPAMVRPFLASILTIVCDSDKKAELEAFFKPKFEHIDGGPRAMAQALEELDQCSAQRKAQAPGIAAFLAKQ